MEKIEDCSQSLPASFTGICERRNSVAREFEKFADLDFILLLVSPRRFAAP
jgi:hypothetical protein